ncbi:hypothetical protein DID74_00595 [Candidatus Marinamargulisbacteria bacterium SCGC AG-333-B06]|nr:hypothetical protein DID74_00595 [Candidatus Marinamargulisbacteria bacterium SCGC AG-333-B06]
MKTICLDFQKIRKTHFIYALYIIHTLQSKFPNKPIKYLLNDTIENDADACHLSNSIVDIDEYQNKLRENKVEANIRWDAVSNITANIENSTLIIKPSKNKRLLKQFLKSGKWVLYDEANSILKAFNIKHYSYLEFLKLIPKKDWVSTLIEKTIDKNKTIMYISLTYHSISKQTQKLISRWLKKLLETEAVCIILNTKINMDINHPHLHQIKEETINYYDEMLIINAVDVYAGIAGGIEQVAVLLKKPIFLFVAHNQWSIANNGCWVNYLKLCNIRRLDQLDNNGVLKLAEQAYLLFSDLIYAVNLNIKLSNQQLWSIHYVIEHPIAMLFFNIEEQENWREKNINYEQWIIPLTEERWTLGTMKKIAKQSRIYKLAYICGQVKWKNLILFKLINWQNKPARNINWVNNRYYKYVLVEDLIEGLQLIKEKAV